MMVTDHFSGKREWGEWQADCPIRSVLWLKPKPEILPWKKAHHWKWVTWLESCRFQQVTSLMLVPQIRCIRNPWLGNCYERKWAVPCNPKLNASVTLTWITLINLKIVGLACGSICQYPVNQSKTYSSERKCNSENPFFHHTRGYVEKKHTVSEQREGIRWIFVFCL